MQRPDRLRRGLLLGMASLCGGLVLGALPLRAALQDPVAKAAKPAPTKDLRVLFVGNSYCYVNELPKLLSDLAASQPRGPKVAVESVTPGGATLKQHFESSGALQKIRTGGFTHVVLQGQSLEPLTRPEEFQEFARKLAVEIEKSGAQVVFYQTWARREGDSAYAESWSGGTPKKMQAALSEAYAKAAAEFGGRVARAGDAWRSVLDEQEPPALFDVDGSHPSPLGTYLAACVCYETLTGKSCAELEAQREGVSKRDATRMRRVAHAVAGK